MPTLELRAKDGSSVFHSVPDVAQDVLVLESATQTLSGKTLHPGTSGLMIALADAFPSPDADAVHIWKGSVGTVSAADNSILVLEDATNVLLQFLSSNSSGILFGDTNTIVGRILYQHSTNALTIRINNTEQLSWTTGTYTFQVATTISTSTGNLTISAANKVLFSKSVELQDDILLQFGNGNDIAMLNRATSLAADGELSNVIVGTSNHQGVAANSLVVSNITDDGDMLLLVNDGGNSLEMIKMTGATAELSLGWGALKLGLGKDLAAITRPATVTANAASIITALINLGLFTA